VLARPGFSLPEANLEPLSQIKFNNEALYGCRMKTRVLMSLTYLKEKGMTR
jgi:hypothetical protein